MSDELAVDGARSGVEILVTSGEAGGCSNRFERDAGDEAQLSAGGTAIASPSVLAGGTGASAGDAGFPAFEGLWHAIDSFDGSNQHLSITCSRQDACDVRPNDTAFTFSCPDPIGFAQGVGSIERNVLSVELSLYCSNLDGTSTVVGPQENEFVLDRSPVDRPSGPVVQRCGTDLGDAETAREREVSARTAMTRVLAKATRARARRRSPAGVTRGPHAR